MENKRDGRKRMGEEFEEQKWVGESGRNIREFD